jgi:hypothetical protein
VELDSITGRIARHLYPQPISPWRALKPPTAGISTILPSATSPFGNYKVPDKPYDKLNFNIHDYFFAKAIDQVRPGGVVAFITSKGTMDKRSPEVRKYLAQRDELLGAVRLPNNAFKANAGTEVTTDILFLQKRDRAIDIEPDWVHLADTEDGIPVNSYFTEHPEMMLGTLHGMTVCMGIIGKPPVCLSRTRSFPNSLPPPWSISTDRSPKQNSRTWTRENLLSFPLIQTYAIIPMLS